MIRATHNRLSILLILISGGGAEVFQVPKPCHSVGYEVIPSEGACLSAAKELALGYATVSVTVPSLQESIPFGCYEVTGAKPGLWFNPVNGSDEDDIGNLALCTGPDGQGLPSFNPTPAHCSDVCSRVAYQGYPCECHSILTSDGFVLQTVRIPRQRHFLEKRPPAVWLQHGFEGSCADWISQPKPSDNLGYMLYGAGFDVWMGNARGNVFAFNNTKLPIDKSVFWSAVDIDTMASIDTPSVIDYVLTVTKQRTLSWIGHSQGTTQMLAALSQRYTLKDGRHIAEALDSVALMAPVAYVFNSKSLLLQFLADVHFEHLDVLLGNRDFLGPKLTWLIHQLSIFCKIPELCPVWYWPIMGGGNFSNTDPLTLANATLHDPADSSVHNLEHWTQHMRKDRFGMFDYGSKVNKQKYNSTTAPDYKLNAITGVKIAVFNGMKDDLSDPKDVARLLAEVPLDSVVFHKPLQHYGHMDFIWGRDAHVEVYPDMVQFLKNHSAHFEIV